MMPLKSCIAIAGMFLLTVFQSGSSSGWLDGDAGCSHSSSTAPHSIDRRGSSHRRGCLWTMVPPRPELREHR
uniref:Putative secreted protein n=1 Tax=Anopheles marajoara TaxID=58244 RepID=A0A2M4CEA5_9DIPT